MPRMIPTVLQGKARPHSATMDPQHTGGCPTGLHCLSRPRSRSVPFPEARRTWMPHCWCVSREGVSYSAVCNEAKPLLAAARACCAGPPGLARAGQMLFLHRMMDVDRVQVRQPACCWPILGWRGRPSVGLPLLYWLELSLASSSDPFHQGSFRSKPSMAGWVTPWPQ